MLLRPNLQQVAREAKVSHMNVSRVVRDSPLVKKQTAKHVMEVIQKLGYRPDPVLSA
jgi:LacI family transcriptional regulator